MARSVPFVAGNVIKASDINNMRDDILSPTYGHIHDGTSGAQIEHSDLKHLSSGAPYTILHEHDDVDSHIDASSGVHGGSSSEYVLLCMGAYLIQMGRRQWQGWTSDTTVHDVTFPQAYSTAPKITVTGYIPGVGTITHASALDAETGLPLLIATNDTHISLLVIEITTTGFKVACRWQESGNQPTGNVYFDWMAIGAK